MWSDDIDKKIQEAAEHHLPPFREEDWSSMNVLLDKHLPEEKKKRRSLPGMLFLLLAGFPVLIMLTTYKSAPLHQLGAQKTRAKAIERSEQKNGNSSTDETIIAEPGNHYNAERSSATSKTSPPFLRTQQHYPNPTVISVSGENDMPQQHGITGSVLRASDERHDSISINETPAESAFISSRASTQTTIDSITDHIPALHDTLQQETATGKKNQEREVVKGAKWQLNVSFGPDLSLVGIRKTGDWKMQYGIGAGYSVSKRVQIRTGFIVSRKLYYADSSDYNPPKGFWSYYPNLQKIDANCLVYEIPLNVVYTFPSIRKHHWFVSGGLSSYLMKEETYEYYFKDASGDQYRARTIYNENDHFFSILQLSGGYQRKLSDKISLMAEPYIKIPLGGVGFGKVKLNNTGLLFTVGYRPFAGRNK